MKQIQKVCQKANMFIKSFRDMFMKCKQSRIIYIIHKNLKKFHNWHHANKYTYQDMVGEFLLRRRGLVIGIELHSGAKGLGIKV